MKLKRRLKLITQILNTFPLVISPCGKGFDWKHYPGRNGFWLTDFTSVEQCRKTLLDEDSRHKQYFE